MQMPSTSSPLPELPSQATMPPETLFLLDRLSNYPVMSRRIKHRTKHWGGRDQEISRCCRAGWQQLSRRWSLNHWSVAKGSSRDFSNDNPCKTICVAARNRQSLGRKGKSMFKMPEGPKYAGTSTNPPLWVASRFCTLARKENRFLLQCYHYPPL